MVPYLFCKEILSYVLQFDISLLNLFVFGILYIIIDCVTVEYNFPVAAFLFGHQY